MKKKVSILIPCYNETSNIEPMCKYIVMIMEKELATYDYELVFIDNDSHDGTREKLRQICDKNKNIRAILNAKNFGQNNSPYYGMCQTTGDCTMVLSCDFQDPPELIPIFIREWELGYKIVCGIKSTSKENRIVRFFRSIYYLMIKKMSQIDQIEHFTGFGLYDSSFIEIMRSLKDPTPFLRGVVAEFGYKRKDIQYEQARRMSGKTHNNWYTLYDVAMLSFTSYTKIGLRIVTIAGGIFAVLSFFIALVYLILKIIYWDRYSAGTAPILIGMLLLGSIQIFIIGLIGEYIMNINTRVMNRPLVIEEERLNF